jgi:flavin-dependent dehydrogenase
MYDVIIVGGGPAGATLARMIGKRYKVLLLEKRSFADNKDSTYHKCCGGLIDPDAQLMLAKFRLGIPKSVVLSPQLFAVRTIDIDNSIERYYQRHYINIDREKFDKWLESIIPSEVHIINDAIYKSFEINDGIVNVKFHHNGKEYTEKTKLLVGADGAFSKVRKQGFIDHPKPKVYISIQEWFETKQNADYYGAIFDKEITDFYSWTIPKEKYLILGSALKPGKDASEKFRLLKGKLQSYGFEFNKLVRKEGAYLLRPTDTSQICTGNSKVALLGEAAGFISPSSAEGLSYAFRSAVALAKALDNGQEGYYDEYLANLKSLERNIMFKNLKSPAMYNKYLRKVIMKTGVLSIGME